MGEGANLPIHRMPGRSGGVFVSASELDTELDSSRSGLAEASIQNPPIKPSLHSASETDTTLGLEHQPVPPSNTKWRALWLTSALTAPVCTAIAYSSAWHWSCTSCTQRAMPQSRHSFLLAIESIWNPRISPPSANSCTPFSKCVFSFDFSPSNWLFTCFLNQQD